MKNITTFSVIYLLALFFLGLGYLSIQPIFEGFDETAHYSSIRQIDNQGTFPLYGFSYIDKSVIDYQGPFAYGSGKPPFDKALTYQAFFNQSNLINNYINKYRELPFSDTYQPSTALNWQSQHPPLYYWIMAQLNKLINGHFSFAAQFFILRFFSYLLALGGVALGLLAIKHYLPSHKTAALRGFIAYSLILPMFIPEFTRVGNDSLCIFLIGLLTLFFALWNKAQHKIKYGLLIGFTLAVGMVTKAFFVPITLGISVFLFIKIWCEQRSIFSFIEAYLPLILPIIAIGSSWNVYQYVKLGHLITSADMAILAEQGGFIVNWKAHYSLMQLIIGMLTTVVTYVWAGSWSLVKLNWLLYVPQLVLLAWVSITAYFSLKKFPITNLIWLPIWILAFFVIGFIYHIFICIAAYGTGNTPGWYLHILMPWIAPLVGLGIRKNLLFFTLIFYAVLFQIIVIWSQLALYMGCATKGIAKNYLFTEKYFCLDQATQLFNNLSVLGWPYLAVCGFSVGFLLYLLLIKKVIYQ